MQNLNLDIADLSGVRIVGGAEELGVSYDPNTLLTVLHDGRYDALKAKGHFGDANANRSGNLFQFLNPERSIVNTNIKSISLRQLHDSGFQDLAEEILRYKAVFETLTKKQANVRIDLMQDGYKSTATGRWHRDPGNSHLSAILLYRFGRAATGGEFRFVTSNVPGNLVTGRNGRIQDDLLQTQFDDQASVLPMGHFAVFNRNCFNGLVHAGSAVEDGLRLRVLMDPAPGQ